MTAVLVSHDGARWLPQVLAAVLAQTRRPDVLVAVDTASVDNSPALLAAALGPASVLSAPRDTGFGGAVSRALEMVAERASPGVDGKWVWLLHDDCAPAPDALERLLDGALGGPDDGNGPIGVVGPKVREWPSLQRLLEVGVSISGTGVRETGLERGEPDQGQRDEPRQVLAVGTAGALVRRTTWDRVGGLEPRLPVFGDDLDLGWRVTRAGSQVQVAPAAVVFHAEAAASGLRTPGALTRSSRRERRRAALFVLLINCRGSVLGVQYVRLLLGSLLRVGGLLLVKAPRDAWEEACAAACVLGRPWRLRAPRRARRRTALAPASVVAPLLPSALQPYRDGAATLAELVGGLLAPRGASIPRALVEPGPVAAEAEQLPAERGPLARVAARPWASAVLILALVCLLAARQLLGGGELQGGALLPAPASALDWWAAYTAGWHPVGVGSSEPSPPYVLLLAAMALFTLGDAGAVVSLLLLAAPVLAALGAHRLLRRVGAGLVAAGWGAVSYGSLPLVSGALAQGRLGTVLGTVVLPLLATALVSLAGADPSATPGARAQRWSRRARTGLVAAALVALVPVAWPLLAAVVALSVLLVASRTGVALPPLRHAVVSGAVVLAVPFVLGPWWLSARVADASLWWWEAGLPDAGIGVLDPGVVDLLLADPGGPGGVAGAVRWLGAGVLLAAVAALVRTGGRGPVLVSWTIGGLGLLVAAIGVAAGAWPVSATGPAAVWVGFPLVVWWGALLAAAALGSNELGPLLARRSFGWRQPAAAVVVGLALLGPPSALCWAAVDGIGSPLRRADPVPVPAYMAEEAQLGARPAITVLVGTDDRLAATVVRDDGWRLGEEPMQVAAVSPVLTAALGGLLVAPSRDGADPVADLAALGIGYLYAPGPVDEDLGVAVDSATGVVRAGAPVGDRAWRLDRPVRTIDQSRPDGRTDGRGWTVAAQLVALLGLALLAAPARGSRS